MQRHKVIGFLYRGVFKPMLFKLDAELVHNMFTAGGEWLGGAKTRRDLIKNLIYYKNNCLRQNVWGMTFDNPIGLAGGFDYEARLTQILPEVGFGFQTVGSVTYGVYEGNPKPRLGRLPKSKSLLVNKGLKSSGAEAVIGRLANKKFRIPVGVSVAKTNCVKTAKEKKGIEDYTESLKLWEKSKRISYYELNISCPNAFGGEPFTTPMKLKRLLDEVDRLKLKRSLLLKMPVELTERETGRLCQVACKHKVQGLIFGNLVKDRKNPKLVLEEVKRAKKGSFSGRPTYELSNRLIRFAYKHFGKEMVIVGCGGVFSAEEAYEKIKLGASLVQLITGMIFEGPQLIGEINRGLVQLLERDGLKNISEARGVVG